MLPAKLRNLRLCMVVMLAGKLTISLLLMSSLVIACNAIGWYFGLSLSFGFNLTAPSTNHCSLREEIRPVWCQLIITGVVGHIEEYVKLLTLDRPLMLLPKCISAIEFLFTVASWSWWAFKANSLDMTKWSLACPATISAWF